MFGRQGVALAIFAEVVGATRRWLLVVLHSRVAKVLSFPPLTLLLYVVSPWALVV